MPSYTVGQAARLTGKSKPTITRAIKAGTLSATRNDDGSYSIDPAELSRVFGLSGQSGVTLASNVGRNMTRSETPDVPGTLQRENELLREMLIQRDGVIDDLRGRLDEERAERRQTADRLAAAQERITALLTDQRQAAPLTPMPTPAPEKRRRWWWSRD
jgi:excisionase family DNA binding protein